jgi:hypothetical protein
MNNSNNQQDFDYQYQNDFFDSGYPPKPTSLQSPLYYRPSTTSDMMFALLNKPTPQIESLAP